MKESLAGLWAEKATELYPRKRKHHERGSLRPRVLRRTPLKYPTHCVAADRAVARSNLHPPSRLRRAQIIRPSKHKKNRRRIQLIQDVRSKDLASCLGRLTAPSKSRDSSQHISC